LELRRVNGVSFKPIEFYRAVNIVEEFDSILEGVFPWLESRRANGRKAKLPSPRMWATVSHTRSKMPLNLRVFLVHHNGPLYAVIAKGRLPAELNLEALTRADLPHDWATQQRQLASV